MSKNKFIVIEGFDGDGKTTLSKWVANNYDYIYHKSPSGVFADTRIFFDKSDIQPYERFAFYCGECIRASCFADLIFEKGENVVMDRYYLSTLAYHKALQLNLYESYRDIFKFLKKPDLFILLQVEFDTIKERINGRQLLLNDKYFVTKEFWKIINDNFIEVANSMHVNYAIVDNNGSIEETKNEIRGLINEV